MATYLLRSQSAPSLGLIIQETKAMEKIPATQSIEQEFYLGEIQKTLEKTLADEDISDKPDNSDDDDDEDFDSDDSDEDGLEGPLLDGHGDEITEEYLIYEMRHETRLSYDQKVNLMPKIRSYLRSINRSKGFECKDYPGHILGFTLLRPRQIVIDERDRFPEGYHHLMYMSNLALKAYANATGNRYEVLYIKEVNVTVSKVRNYNLTFAAFRSVKFATFRACVADDVIEGTIEVTYCKIKTTELLDKEPSSAKTIAVKSLFPDLQFPLQIKLVDLIADRIQDPVKVLSRLHSAHPSELLGLINPSQKEDTEELLEKVIEFIDSAVKSEGFSCRCYPVHLVGYPSLEPREEIIDDMHYLPECEDHILLMARLGLDHFYKCTSHGYLVGEVLKLNMWKVSDCLHVYYITFVAVEPIASYQARIKTCDRDGVCKRLFYRFEAKVLDEQDDIDVFFCRRAHCSS